MKVFWIDAGGNPAPGGPQYSLPNQNCLTFSTILRKSRIKLPSVSPLGLSGPLMFRSVKYIRVTYLLARTVVDHFDLKQYSMPGNNSRQTGKFYGVANGRQNGVYSSHNNAMASTDGYSGSSWKGFGTRSEARSFVSNAGLPGQKSASPTRNSHQRGPSK